MTIYTDSLHKIAYATDASVYREIPYGVAYPETEADVRELLKVAREKNVDLIPRAGGTSLAGQVVGSGIVVDISKHWNRIIEIKQPLLYRRHVRKQLLWHSLAGLWKYTASCHCSQRYAGRRYSGVIQRLHNHRT